MEDDEENSIKLPLKITQLSRPDQNHCYLAKLPSYFKADPRPYNPSLLADEIPDKQTEDEVLEESRLRAENTIRWRYIDSDSEKKDSNARLVRWSDDSFSLLLGDELFEVGIRKMNHEHQYLVALHEKEAVMQTCSRLTNMMMLAPASTSSAIHRKLTSSIRNRHQKNTRTKIYAKLEDPEKLRREEEKVWVYYGAVFSSLFQRDRENWKAQRKLLQDRRRVLAQYDDGAYKDQSDSDGERRFQSGRGSSRYEDEYEEEEDEDEDAQDERIMKSKHMPVEEDDVEDESMSDEEPIEKRVDSKPISKRRIIDSDDDD
ncbi:hypothetical protein HDU97_004084 [Phlyctochytrium planicorne]|nr:hypothetical protein HDU97_004084 [Phlyctochytrium planicorne]